MRFRPAVFLAIVAVVLLAMTVRADAQQAGRIYRIGFLGNSTAALEANLIGPFRQGLRDLGYIEGVNSKLEFRWAEGRYERFPALIAELIALKVDVIVTAGTPAALAVKKATSIPLVMVAVGDPVGTGLAASLSRPGGNATGLSSIAPDLEGKRLDLLRTLVPRLSHIAVLWNPANLFHVVSSKQTRAAAQAMGIRVEFLAAQSLNELSDAFSAMAKNRAQAVIVFADRFFLHNRARVAEFAIERRLPTVVTHQELVESGALMSFGANYPDMHRRAATYVDRILKGAKPGPADRAAHEVRPAHQPEDRACARHHDPAVARAARRSGDRVAAADRIADDLADGKADGVRILPAY